MPGGELGPHARRLVARCTPDAYVGLVVRAIPATEVERNGTIERTPDHFLGALWAPPGRGPSRWPEAVVIGSPKAEHAIVQLCDHLPPDGRLYLASRDEVDASLAARILRDADRNLEPYQRAALDQLIEAERARDEALVRERYTDRDPRYERFRAIVLASPRTNPGR